MNWKTKARIQNIVAAFPSTISHAAYYWIQRHFGNFKKTKPVRHIKAATETWNHIQSLGINASGKIFFEIGTGRALNVPLTYWLMGAKGTITIDLNPYLKRELIQESIDYILTNKNEIERLLSPFLDRSRFIELSKIQNSSNVTTEQILELCNITYISPCDAAQTGLEDKCIDFHTSHSVFEHIPPDDFGELIREGNRITKEKGLFVHNIDYSDHFSHSDKKISAINFLQYSDAVWHRYAGNRYMYTNRLRHDDFLEIIRSSGHRVLLNQPRIDPHLLRLLRSETFAVNEKFKKKSIEILATSGAWLVSQKSG